MPVGDIYETKIEGVANSARRWNNVLHWRLLVEAEPDLFETSEVLSGEVLTKFVAGFQDLMGASTFITSTRANRVYPTVGIPAVTPTVGTIEGTVESDSLPPDVALVVTKRSKEPGKSGRGRLYLTGIPESVVQLDLIAEVTAALWATAAADLLTLPFTDANDNEWVPCIFSRKLADAEAPIAHADIWRVEVDRTLRNMRPRGRKEAFRIQGAQS